ncbi:hypothetical protein N9502_03070 [Vicingaceae bacterium]|nr:hypothetical protein [Vicingaceae bacterium]
METGLSHLHNLLRYAIVIFLIINVVKSFLGWFGKIEYTAGDNKLSLFLFISAHLQLVVGFVLYSVSGVVKVAMSDMGDSMKDTVLRFWAVEHMLSMVVGIIIITLGRIMAKKAKSDSAKFRRQAIYFTLAMVIIFAAIPWPWAAEGIARAWF